MLMHSSVHRSVYVGYNYGSNTLHLYVLLLLLEL